MLLAAVAGCWCMLLAAAACCWCVLLRAAGACCGVGTAGLKPGPLLACAAASIMS
jgi:hypothetical protein